MKKSKVSEIKREQKKSFLLQEISALVRQITADESRLSSLFVTRVELSRDGGICFIYFSTHTTKEAFDEGFPLLKLYKPSMRKALSQAMSSRYVPNLVFKYDETKEKERKITGILDKIASEDDSSDE
ncbi:ribosome-binding factor A [Candidatus Dependentiae bacterium]|nr:ribosome-binding factor A [Candidatus Dependentiae bacterium]